MMSNVVVERLTEEVDVIFKKLRKEREKLSKAYVEGKGSCWNSEDIKRYKTLTDTLKIVTDMCFRGIENKQQREQFTELKLCVDSEIESAISLSKALINKSFYIQHRDLLLSIERLYKVSRYIDSTVDSYDRINQR